jgi:hypothetical protein
VTAWNHPLTIALVAVGSSLLTIFRTPYLQHWLWMYQRRAENKLAAIKEFNRLTTQFITGVMANPGGGFIPTTNWFQAFNMVGADIEALFSQPAKDALKAVDALIGPSRPGLGAQGNNTPNDFIAERDAAMRIFYREVIPT